MTFSRRPATQLAVSTLEINRRNIDQDCSTTEHWVQRAREGDVDAFAKLVQSYHRRVLAHVAGIVGDAETADDIAQDVFLAAYQSLDQFAGKSEFSTWLIGIARNKAISALRRKIARQRHEQPAGLHLLAQWKLDYVEGSNEAQRSDQIESLRRCLEKLKPEHRRLLDRHYGNNQTTESIAKETGRSSSGVRMLFLRLRQALHECIQRQTNQ